MDTWITVNYIDCLRYLQVLAKLQELSEMRSFDFYRNAQKKEEVLLIKYFSRRIILNREPFTMLTWNCPVTRIT